MTPIPQTEIEVFDFEKANPVPKTTTRLPGPGRPPGPERQGLSSPYAYERTLQGSPVDQAYQENPDAFFNSYDPNVGIRREKPEHRIVIMLKAQGKSNREIARATGKTEVWVSQVVRQPWAKARIAHEITEAGRDQVTELLKGEVTNSIYTLIEVRDEAPDARDRANAANSLLDRFLGKPTQRTENVNLNANLDVGNVQKLDSELAELEAEIARHTGGSASTETAPREARVIEGGSVVPAPGGGTSVVAAQ